MKKFTIKAYSVYDVTKPVTNEEIKSYCAFNFKIDGRTLKKAIDNAKDCVNATARNISKDTGYKVTAHLYYAVEEK